MACERDARSGSGHLSRCASASSPFRAPLRCHDLLHGDNRNDCAPHEWCAGMDCDSKTGEGQTKRRRSVKKSDSMPEVMAFTRIARRRRRAGSRRCRAELAVSPDPRRREKRCRIAGSVATRRGALQFLLFFLRVGRALPHGRAGCCLVPSNSLFPLPPQP